MKVSIALSFMLALKANAFSSQSISQSQRIRTSALHMHMQQPPTLKDRIQSSDLSAYASDTSLFDEALGVSVGSTTATTSSSSSSSAIPEEDFWNKYLLPVGSASLLITGNTVGAGMLVLPELAQEPGMLISSGVFVVAYLMNWISGLCIAQVAIQQHETSGDEVPSSFKEFAQANLFDSASTIVSAISIFVNALVLAFDTTKAGQVGTKMLADITTTATTTTAGVSPLLDGSNLTYLWTALMLAVVSTQSLQRLSQVASFMVMGLFLSFAGLLLPGLAHVSDPLAVLLAGPSETTNVATGVLHMAPIFVSTLVYQNIVPTVTRILDYDRSKVVAAISLGSFLPLCIYLAWCVTVLGGGIAAAGGAGTGTGLAATGPLLTIFSLVTVAGSSMGALMSLSEEFEILLGQEKKDTFSLPSVALPSLIALGTCQIFADDINVALQVAGSYGSPLLYGLIPVAMAYLQAQKQQQQQKQQDPSPSVVPGGMAGLGLLGLGATALVGTEFASTLSQWI